jgi:hypothetical protein
MATAMIGPVRLAWLVVTVMIVLTPMAWASSPDPSWIEGVYDDKDFDDVVSYLTSGTLAVPPLPASDLSPMFATAPTELMPPDLQLAAAPLLSFNEPRAPPLS